MKTFAKLSPIDLSSLFSDRQAKQAALGKALYERIQEEGGLIVTGFPAAQKLDELAHRCLGFFELEAAAKREVAVAPINPSNPNIYRGYLASLEPDAWAHNEFFDIGPQAPFDAGKLEGLGIERLEVLSEVNVWPSQEPCPGWRKAMLDFYDVMNRLSTALMIAIGEGAGFERREIAERYSRGNSTHRLLNYPVPPKNHHLRAEEPDSRIEEEEPKLSAARHTDASGLSLLWQAQPGLQAQAPDGTWRDVPILPNSLSVHVGTAFEMMTEGEVPATPHRVLNLEQARQSMGFFLEPALDVPLACMSKAPWSSQSQSQKLSPQEIKQTYGWHLLERLHSYSGNEDLVPQPAVKEAS